MHRAGLFTGSGDCEHGVRRNDEARREADYRREGAVVVRGRACEQDRELPRDAGDAYALAGLEASAQDQDLGSGSYELD